VVHHSDGRRLWVLGCYHVSQQNTFTGRLTSAMLDSVLTRAREIATSAR
jgi:uracil-DNA glycosylase